MLDLFGRGYVIEHCVSTHNSFMRDRMYRSYISDLLMNLAKQNGLRVSKRYEDLAYPKLTAKEETRTPEEIINSISEKLKKLGEDKT